MEIFRDFREWFELLNAKKVEYVIVGGYATVFHGYPHGTKDIDVYVRPTEQNAERVMAALDAFGFGKTGLKKEDFEKPDQIVQMGVAPVRIDVITSIEAVTWERAEKGKVMGDYDGVPVPFLGRDELIANKKAVGRPVDIADVAELERLAEPRPKKKTKRG